MRTIFCFFLGGNCEIHDISIGVYPVEIGPNGILDVDPQHSQSQQILVLLHTHCIFPFPCQGTVFSNPDQVLDLFDC